MSLQTLILWNGLALAHYVGCVTGSLEPIQIMLVAWQAHWHLMQHNGQDLPHSIRQRPRFRSAFHFVGISLQVLVRICAIMQVRVWGWLFFLLVTGTGDRMSLLWLYLQHWFFLDTSQDKFLSNCSYFKTAYSQKVDSKFSHICYCSSKFSGH